MKKPLFDSQWRPWPGKCESGQAVTSHFSFELKRIQQSPAIGSSKYMVVNFWDFLIFYCKLTRGNSQPCLWPPFERSDDEYLCSDWPLIRIFVHFTRLHALSPRRVFPPFLSTRILPPNNNLTFLKNFELSIFSLTISNTSTSRVRIIFQIFTLC
jgi:hypothetical protein